MANQAKRYELRLYDRALLVFSAMADAFGNVSFSVLDSDDDARSLPPLMRDLRQNSLKEWLDTRVVPKNRRFADKILAQAGLTPGDTMGIIDVCLGLSINDAYGSQTPAGSNLPFDQVLQVVMTERHREALRRMLSFELTNHPVYPVDEERLDALNRLLGARVRQMLAIEPTSSADVLARIEGTLPEDAFVPAAAVGV